MLIKENPTYNIGNHVFHMSCLCTCIQTVLTDSNSHKKYTFEELMICMNFELDAREPNNEDDSETEKSDKKQTLVRGSGG